MRDKNVPLATLLCTRTIILMLNRGSMYFSPTWQSASGFRRLYHYYQNTAWLKPHTVKWVKRTLWLIRHSVLEVRAYHFSKSSAPHLRFLVPEKSSWIMKTHPVSFAWSFRATCPRSRNLCEVEWVRVMSAPARNLIPMS